MQMLPSTALKIVAVCASETLVSHYRVMSSFALRLSHFKLPDACGVYSLLVLVTGLLIAADWAACDAASATSCIMLISLNFAVTDRKFA